MFTNLVFYVSWGVIAFIPLLIAIFATKGIKKKIIACLSVLIISFGVITFMFYNAEDSNKRWNNGFCECGGTYKLCTTSQYRFYHYYYYACDTCGHVEEFYELME